MDITEEFCICIRRVKLWIRFPIQNKSFAGTLPRRNVLILAQGNSSSFCSCVHCRKKNKIWSCYKMYLSVVQRHGSSQAPGSALEEISMVCRLASGQLKEEKRIIKSISCIQPFQKCTVIIASLASRPQSLWCLISTQIQKKSLFKDEDLLTQGIWAGQSSGGVGKEADKNRSKMMAFSLKIYILARKYKAKYDMAVIFTVECFCLSLSVSCHIFHGSQNYSFTHLRA